MKKRFNEITFFIIISLIVTGNVFSQEKSIKDLEFLIGVWEVREDNNENDWWEKATRTGRYILDSTYIELNATAISSTGRERTYRWFIHYNSKKQQFEMVSMFSSYHEVLVDILIWNSTERKLIIRNNAESGPDEFHERYGEIIFDENFNEYIWKGENKYGDENKPSIWKYIEKGLRTK